MYRILIVDDEFVIRDGLSEGIKWRDLGFSKPDTAGNGREALVLMEQRLPDLVITDVKMPIMDGIELCGYIRKTYPSVRTIILSGFGEFEFARQAIDQKVSAYLLKPLKEDQLVELVSAIRQDLDHERQLMQSVASEAEVKVDPDDQLQIIFLKLLSGNTQDVEHDLDTLLRLGIDLRQNWFTVMAMAADGLPSRLEQEQAKSLFASIQAFWQSFNAPVLYLNKMWLIVLCEPAKLNKSALLHRIRQFQDMLNKSAVQIGSEFPFSFGVSTCGNSWRDLSRFQAEAEQALQERFYNINGQVFFYSELEPASEIKFDPAALTQYAAAIAGKLIQQKSHLLLDIIRQLCEKLQAIKTRDINLLNVRFVQIYTAILNQVKAEYVYLSAPTVDEFYARISNCRTFDALAHEFQVIIFDLAQQIASYKQNSDRQQFITRLKQYIRLNYNAKLSLDQLAQTFFINASYLSKIFKEETNEKLSDFIMSVRLTNAKNLLRLTPARIQDIAAQVGYDDYRHFCTVFKKATGLTPLQYRIKSV